MQFKIGDFACLNSGGPTMKVLGIEGDQVRCTWRSEGKMDEAAWPSACLMKVHPDPFIPTGDPKWIGEARK